MDKKDVKYFLGKNVNVSISERDKEFLYYGVLKSISDTSALIVNDSFGDTIVVLKNITKISERRERC